MIGTLPRPRGARPRRGSCLPPTVGTRTVSKTSAAEAAAGRARTSRDGQQEERGGSCSRCNARGPRIWRRATRKVRAVAITVVRVLEEDPGPRRGARRRPSAPSPRSTSSPPSSRVPRGPWRPTTRSAQRRGDLGFLILDGLLVRETAIGRHATAELLGAGDLLRPWDHTARTRPRRRSTTEHAWRVLAARAPGGARRALRGAVQPLAAGDRRAAQPHAAPLAAARPAARG